MVLKACLAKRCLLQDFLPTVPIVGCTCYQRTISQQGRRREAALIINSHLSVRGSLCIGGTWTYLAVSIGKIA